MQIALNPFLKLQQLKKVKRFHNKSPCLPFSHAYYLQLDVSLFKTLNSDCQHHCGFSSHLQMPSSQDACVPKVENRSWGYQASPKGSKGTLWNSNNASCNKPHSWSLFKEDFCKVNSKAKHPPLEGMWHPLQSSSSWSSKRDQIRKICHLCPHQGKRLRELASWTNLSKWLQNPEPPWKRRVHRHPCGHQFTNHPISKMYQSQSFAWDPERLYWK